MVHDHPSDDRQITTSFSACVRSYAVNRDVKIGVEAVLKKREMMTFCM